MALELWARLHGALRRLVRDERGQSLTEYGLILALVAVVVIGVLAAIGGQLNTLFARIRDCLQSGAC